MLCKPIRPSRTSQTRRGQPTRTVGIGVCCRRRKNLQRIEVSASCTSYSPENNDTAASGDRQRGLRCGAGKRMSLGERALKLNQRASYMHLGQFFVRGPSKEDDRERQGTVACQEIQWERSISLLKYRLEPFRLQSRHLPVWVSRQPKCFRTAV